VRRLAPRARTPFPDPSRPRDLMIKSILPTKLRVAAAIALWCTALNANTVSVVWDGPESFTSASISFTGFTANQLISFTNSTGAAQGAFARDPNDRIDGTLINLDIHLDGNWVNIWSDTMPTGGVWFLADVGAPYLGESYRPVFNTPINFTEGTIDALRWVGVAPDNAWNFRNFTGDDIFNFSRVAEPVPDVGSAMPLLGFAVVALAALARRRLAPTSLS
jgi:hypothetical protein